MTKHNIKIYGTKTCAYCDSLKEYLDERGIEYKYIDVGEDQEKARHIIKKSGQSGVPVSEIDDEVIIGFDKVKIDKLLEIKD